MTAALSEEQHSSPIRVDSIGGIVLYGSVSSMLCGDSNLVVTLQRIYPSPNGPGTDSFPPPCSSAIARARLEGRDRGTGCS